VQLERSTVHAVLSATAFGVHGLVTLALIPILIAAYDPVGFGLISLARLLLPVGILAILDLGLAEITTQIVARARGSNDWTEARGQLGLCVAIALGVGIPAGVLLILVGQLGLQLFGVPADLHAEFTRMLWASGVLMPWLFLSLVIEGYSKGAEDFQLLRMVEIGAALGYAVLALAAVYTRSGMEMVHYAFLATMALRPLALLPRCVSRRIGLARWSGADRQFVLQRAALFFKGKFVGISAGQLPAMLVAAFFGPASLAMLEVVQKIPGFAKNIFSVTLGVLVPVAMRIDVQGKSDRFARMGRRSLALASFFFLPPIVALMALSERVLAHWLGAQFTHLWPWLAVAAVWPMTAIVLQCTQSILLGRVSFLEASLRLTLRLTLVSLALSLALAPFLKEMGFVLGIALAGTLFLGPFMKLFAVEAGVPVRDSLRLYGGLAGTSAGLGVLFWGLSTWLPGNLVVTLLLLGGYLAVAWGIGYLQLAEDYRSAVRRVLRSVAGMSTFNRQSRSET